MSRIDAAAVKTRARELGFDVCGIAPAAALPELANLSDWLARGYAGEMQYMHKSATTRADIRNFLPSARSVIVTGTNYNTQESGASGASGADAVRVARYARGRDYHHVLEDRLHQLIAWMREHHDEPFDAAAFVDKHHVQERVYAHYAGVGWAGKNTCVINTELGSWLFLAGIATSLDLQPDAPAVDQCASCTQCIDACPTGALVDERELDATKCISYLTIEVDGSIPEDQRALIGQHAYGCDICQEVCPWNLAAAVSPDPAWRGPRRDGLSAAALWQKSDFELHQMVKGSAMTYIPLSRFRRNLAIVLANTGDRDLASAFDTPGRGVRNAARSTTSPIVEDAVAWAKHKLAR